MTISPRTAVATVPEPATPTDWNQVVTVALPNYRRWLYRTAYALTGQRDADYVDDLVQEGYVAMWRVAARYDPARGALPALLTRAAAQRMQLVAARGYRTWTGREPQRGQPAERLVPAEPTELDGSDARAVAALAAVEWAYHDGDLRRALDSLTEQQRRYVILRFWYGWTPTELDAEFRQSRRLWRDVRYALGYQLRHLSDPP